MVTSDLSELRADLQVYEATAARLEAAYSELCDHARRVDQELKDKNRLLASTLGEMDLVLECLPLAVFRERAGQAHAINSRATSLLATHGEIVELQQFDASPKQVESRGVDGVTRRFEGRRVLSDDGVLVFVEDRTSWHSMEQELQRLERLGSLAEIALGIAHEIRNPLNGLAGFASLLRRSPRSPRAGEWAEQIEEGARRVEGTVRDLLDFARPDRRSAPLRLSLGNWLRLAEEELPVEIEADAAALEVIAASRTLDQAFSNLARNSREAGATKAKVRVVSTPAHVLSVRFSDDGPGIDGSVASRIFDPFVGTKEDGSGLGLAFVSRVFSEIGGAIRVVVDSDDADFAGAVFEIDLPVSRAVRTDSGGAE